MTYDYRIAFLTQYDRDLIPKEPVTFRHPLQVGDILQLEEMVSSTWYALSLTPPPA